MKNTAHIIKKKKGGQLFPNLERLLLVYKEETWAMGHGPIESEQKWNSEVKCQPLSLSFPEPGWKLWHYSVQPETNTL